MRENKVEISDSRLVSEGMMLKIRCGDDEELLKLLKENAHRLTEKDVEIRIKLPRSVNKRRIKSEYIEIDKENKLNDKARVEKAMNIIRGLLELNVIVYPNKVEFNEYRTPEYYYEIESLETDYTDVGMYILSHPGTKFYKYMLMEGVISQNSSLSG